MELEPDVEAIRLRQTLRKETTKIFIVRTLIIWGFVALLVGGLFLTRHGVAPSTILVTFVIVALAATIVASANQDRLDNGYKTAAEQLCRRRSIEAAEGLIEFLDFGNACRKPPEYYRPFIQAICECLSEGRVEHLGPRARRDLEKWPKRLRGTDMAKELEAILQPTKDSV